MVTKLKLKSLELVADVTDDHFNAIYPKRIRLLAEKHFTPISVAKTATEFLVTKPGAKVLDIGSGAGKFCMVGAVATKGHFTGIEQRAEFVELSNILAASYQLENVAFIHTNVMSVKFNEYDAFYMYNSFYENIDMHNRIDDTIILNAPLYNAYSRHTFSQLSSLAQGVRLATYYTSPIIVPPSFNLIDTLFDGHLKLWEKS